MVEISTHSFSINFTNFFTVRLECRNVFLVLHHQ